MTESPEPPKSALTVTFKEWATVVFAIEQEEQERENDLVPLASRPIYAPHVLIERLHGRHGTAFHALEIAVHALHEPLDLPLLEPYAGCRSWVDLALPAAR